jgi:hypothetical protein
VTPIPDAHSPIAISVICECSDSLRTTTNSTPVFEVISGVMDSLDHQKGHSLIAYISDFMILKFIFAQSPSINSIFTHIRSNFHLFSRYKLAWRSIPNALERASFGVSCVQNLYLWSAGRWKNSDA